LPGSRVTAGAAVSDDWLSGFAAGMLVALAISAAARRDWPFVVIYLGLAFMWSGVVFGWGA
jgi:hypothetical protein